MNQVLQYKSYVASIHFSSTDKVFYGNVVGDLVSFEGSSVKELEKAFQEAIEYYIEIIKKIGKGAN